MTILVTLAASQHAVAVQAPARDCEANLGRKGATKFTVKGGTSVQQKQVRKSAAAFFTAFASFPSAKPLRIVIDSSGRDAVDSFAGVMSLGYAPATTVEDIQATLAHEAGHYLLDRLIEKTAPDLAQKFLAFDTSDIDKVIHYLQSAGGFPTIPPEQMSAVRANPDMLQMIQMRAAGLAKERRNEILPFSELMADVFALVFTDDPDAISRSFRADGPTPSLADQTFRSFATTGPATLEVMNNAYYRLHRVRAYIGQRYGGLSDRSLDSRAQFVRRIADVFIQTLREHPRIEYAVPLAEFAAQYEKLNDQIIARLGSI